MGKWKIKKEKLVEWSKSLLILALLVSAVLLSIESGYQGVLSDRIDPGGADSTASGNGVSGETGTQSVSQVRPLALEICFDDGQRGAWIYDSSSVDEVFQRFSAALGEALGSAGEPAEVTETRFRKGLEAQGLYLRFVCGQPLGLLSSRLGAAMSSPAAEDSADMLCLCVEGENAVLYYRGGDGNFFRCETGVNVTALASRMSELQSNGAYFAYERDGFEGLEAYTLITEDLPEMAAVTAESHVPGEAETEALFQLLDMNAYVVSPYTESDGTRVYLDGEKTLSVAPNGTASYQRGGARSGRLGGSAAEAIALAREIVESALLPQSGAAQICLSYVESAESRYELGFDYIINGVTVMLEDGYAAYVTVENAVVTELELVFRSYSLSGETIEVLPMLQAAAIVASGESSSLKLTYADTAEGVNCIWVTD